MDRWSVERVDEALADVPDGPRSPATPDKLSFSVSRTSTTGAAVRRRPGLVDPRRRRPALAGAVAELRGRIAQVVPAGGSWLVLVAVDDADRRRVAEPLVHHDRAYWAPAPVVPLRLLG